MMATILPLCLQNINQCTKQKPYTLQKIPKITSPQVDKLGSQTLTSPPNSNPYAYQDIAPQNLIVNTKGGGLGRYKGQYCNGSGVDHFVSLLKLISS